jgi:glucose-6-phosphate isomerase
VSDGVLDPLDRWLEEARDAPIPRSARAFAPDLHAELVAAVRTGEADLAALATDLKGARGTDRRSRALRILDRVGLVERALRATAEAQRRATTGGSMERGTAGTWEDAHLDPIASAFEDARAKLDHDEAVDRMWSRDHTLWQDDPTEVADRLGWLDLPATAADDIGDLEVFSGACAEDGLTHALVLGMGGSSLFPLVLAETSSGDRLELVVLDSVDPAAIRRTLNALPLDRTLVIASSKSGTTIETRSLLAYLWDHSGVAARFTVVTDPGTPLEGLARERGFRAVFTAPEDVGGRYSALTPFGLLPAALTGTDLPGLLASAQRMTGRCRATDDTNPGAALAAVIAAAAGAGRDKLTLVLPEPIAAFGAWVEQLVAESTGKGGVGVLPVVGEPVGPPEVYGDDRLFVAYGEPDGLQALAADGHPVLWLAPGAITDLGAEVVRWEMATALTGALLGINPFDQPDVEAAKRAAKQALSSGAAEPEIEPFAPLLSEVGPGGYLALLAYVDPDSPVIDELETVRVGLRDRLRVPVTLGIGPRYLHSTGQLHKGGPGGGVFALLLGDGDEDLHVPGQEHTFATLERAQAAGDLTALREAGRTAARVSLDELLAER